MFRVSGAAMIAVQSRDVMVQPGSRRVFGHGWAGQEGKGGQGPNSAVHPTTRNPVVEYGPLPKRNVAENPAMYPLTLTLPGHRNIRASAT